MLSMSFDDITSEISTTIRALQDGVYKHDQSRIRSRTRSHCMS